MSHDSVPTIKIWTANGPVVINEIDFDAAVHTRAADDDSGPAAGEQSKLALAPASKPPAPAVVVAPVVVEPAVVAPVVVEPAVAPTTALLVSKIGKKFHAVDQSGAAVERDGISADGYKTEAEAWAAIMALTA
jgi:hypothetical protein